MSLLSFFSGKNPPDAPPNLAHPDFKANPYPFYAKLRAEAPVCRMEKLQGEPGWLVTRYSDVVSLLKDERFIKNRWDAITPKQRAEQPWWWRIKLFGTFERNMLDQDPPVHTRLRALVSKAFTPGLIEQMRERIERLTNELVDKVQDQGRMDLIGDYALPLPTTIIAEMLGVPVDDRHKFHRWSNAMISASSLWGVVAMIPHVWQFLRYNRQLVKRRRGKPQDDLLSAILGAQEAGETLSDEEVEAMVGLLLIAGHETTVNLIGNGMLALLEHPQQMEKLRKDPRLIKSAIEEMLRYASPVEVAPVRYARETVMFAGVPIRRGEMVYAALGCANRDERQFPNADSFDITREPNKHVAFGLGTHFCLGAALARLEGQIAIATLLRRFPDLRLAVAPAELRWRGGLVGRGLEALPVACANR